MLTCSTDHGAIVRRRLTVLQERLKEAAAVYLYDVPADFVFVEPDMFGNRSFGYGACTYSVDHIRTVSFHVPMKRVSLYQTAFTLQLIKTALLIVDTDDVPLGNEGQQCDLDFCSDRFREHGYGHAVGGYLHASVTSWLEAYRTSETTVRHHNGDARMPELVIAAMRETWQSITSDTWRPYEDECRGRIATDGAFILECFGDACDLGVYPSEMWRKEPFHRISCHNLDTAEQQLTLLAGLAMLCQLARGEERKSPEA